MASPWTPRWPDRGTTYTGGGTPANPVGTGTNETASTAQYVGNLTWSNQEQITWSGNLTSTSSTDNYDVAVGEGDTIKQPKPYSPEWPVTIKVDYADGMAGPNTSLYVFNQSGDLILVGQNSGVTDSQAVPALGSDLTDLNRGSEGNGDPYIGPVYLPSGATASPGRIPRATTSW